MLYLYNPQIVRKTKLSYFKRLFTETQNAFFKSASGFADWIEMLLSGDLNTALWSNCILEKYAVTVFGWLHKEHYLNTGHDQPEVQD